MSYQERRSWPARPRVRRRQTLPSLPATTSDEEQNKQQQQKQQQQHQSIPERGPKQGPAQSRSGTRTGSSAVQNGGQNSFGSSSSSVEAGRDFPAFLHRPQLTPRTLTPNHNPNR